MRNETCSTCKSLRKENNEYYCRNEQMQLMNDSELKVDYPNNDCCELYKKTEQVISKKSDYDNFNLDEAFKLAKEGHFMSNKYFTQEQSMHYNNACFYYEDGSNLSTGNFIDNYLKKEDWAKFGWYIKYDKSLVDKDILNKLHKENNGYMLHDCSYEDCIRKADL